MTFAAGLRICRNRARIAPVSTMWVPMTLFFPPPRSSIPILERRWGCDGAASEGDVPTRHPPIDRWAEDPARRRACHHGERPPKKKKE